MPLGAACRTGGLVPPSDADVRWLPAALRPRRIWFVVAPSARACSSSPACRRRWQHRPALRHPPTLSECRCASAGAAETYGQQVSVWLISVRFLIRPACRFVEFKAHLKAGSGQSYVNSVCPGPLLAALVALWSARLLCQRGLLRSSPIRFHCRACPGTSTPSSCSSRRPQLLGTC